MTADDIKTLAEKMHCVEFLIRSNMLLPGQVELPADKARFLHAILWHAARSHLLAIFDDVPLTDDEIDLLEAVAAMAERRLMQEAV